MGFKSLMYDIIIITHLYCIFTPLTRYGYKFYIYHTSVNITSQPVNGKRDSITEECAVMLRIDLRPLKYPIICYSRSYCTSTSTIGTLWVIPWLSYSLEVFDRITTTN